MKKRLFWADLVRVVAIYLVVLIHNLQFPQKIDQSSLITFIAQAISRTSIPLFIMLSGSLLIGKKESYVIFFKKRILKVVIPWLVWTVFFMTWEIIFDHKNINSIKDLKYFFELTFMTSLWFLPLIACIYLLTPLFRKFVEASSKKDRIYLVLIMFIFSSILPFFHNGPTFPLDSGGIFTKAFQYSSYFLAGYIAVKDKFLLRNKKIAYILFALGLALTIFETMTIKPVEQVYSYLSPNIVILTISLFYIIFTLFEERKISKKLRFLFEKISIASLGIYILHQPLMQILNPYLLPFKKFLEGINIAFEGIVMAFIYFSLTSVIVILLQKTPIKKILP